MKEDNKCDQVNDEPGLALVLGTKATVIALFYASWCPFCSRFLPVFHKAAQGKGNFVLVQDDEEKLGEGYSIEVFPTVLFFKDGVLTRRLDGVRGAGLQEEQLDDFLKSCDIK